MLESNASIPSVFGPHRKERYPYSDCKISASFIFCGLCLTMLDSVVHLSNYLLMNLSDDLKIQIKSVNFIEQANTLLLWFNFVDSILKTHLFQSYCVSFYGGVLDISVRGKLKLLKYTITVCGTFGYSLMYHILLFIWLLSLRVCIICCAIDFLSL